MTVNEIVVWCVTVPDVPAAVAVMVMLVVPVGVEGGGAGELPQLAAKEMLNSRVQNAAPRTKDLQFLLPLPLASAERLASSIRARASNSEAAASGACRSNRKLKLPGGPTIATPLTVLIVITGVTTLRFKV